MVKTLLTDFSDHSLEQEYQVLEQPVGQANLKAFEANQAINRVIHTSPSDGDPQVCIVGVGYVGEILLKEFGSVFPAIGFDISEKRLETIKPDFARLKNVRLTSSTEVFKEATHFCISVPTLLREDKSVNTDHLIRAIAMVTANARPGSTIVIESSVSVGMTRALLGPFSSRFHCGMSPERVDPGRTLPAAHEIPKIISALTEPALLSMHKVYSQAFKTVVPVSKPEVAEMTKLFENCYRMINIAYVNEIADACERQQIDVDEVVAAAATKPFGFQSFKPGRPIACSRPVLLLTSSSRTWSRRSLHPNQSLLPHGQQQPTAAPASDDNDMVAAPPHRPRLLQTVRDATWTCFESSRHRHGIQAWPERDRLFPSGVIRPGADAHWMR